MQEEKEVGYGEGEEEMWQSSLITIETAAIPAFIILKFSFGKNNISLIVKLISFTVPAQIRKKRKREKEKKRKSEKSRTGTDRIHENKREEKIKKYAN